MKNIIFELEKTKRMIKRVSLKVQKRSILSEEDAKVFAIFIKKVYSNLQEIESEVTKLEKSLDTKENK